MKLKDPKNKNYCATVVKLSTFAALPKLDRVQATFIFSNQVIVDKSCREGDIGLFFPVETQLSNEFLSNNNLYRDPTLNVDANKKGFFELNGRIRAIKFQGHKSEGFFIPLDSLKYLNYHQFNIGDEFDEMEGHEICKKYVVKHVQNDRGPKRSKADKKLKRVSRLVENQFKFHIDMNSVA